MDTLLWIIASSAQGHNVTSAILVLTSASVNDFTGLFISFLREETLKHSSSVWYVLSDGQLALYDESICVHLDGHSLADLVFICDAAVVGIEIYLASLVYCVFLLCTVIWRLSIQWFNVCVCMHSIQCVTRQSERWFILSVATPLKKRFILHMHLYVLVWCDTRACVLCPLYFY